VNAGTRTALTYEHEPAQPCAAVQAGVVVWAAALRQQHDRAFRQHAILHVEDCDNASAAGASTGANIASISKTTVLACRETRG
jgi:hypothetical protein